MKPIPSEMVAAITAGRIESHVDLSRCVNLGWVFQGQPARHHDTSLQQYSLQSALIAAKDGHKVLAYITIKLLSDASLFNMLVRPSGYSTGQDVEAPLQMLPYLCAEPDLYWGPRPEYRIPQRVVSD